MNFKFRQKTIAAFKFFFVVLILSSIALLFLNGVFEDVEEAYEWSEPPEPRPWYFKEGVYMPQSHKESLKLWPYEIEGDRILNQLMYIPKTQPKRNIKIFLEVLEIKRFWNENVLDSFDYCHVNACEKVENKEEADAILFKNHITRTRKPENQHQTWILWLLESPYVGGKVIQSTSVNMTATYRLDSDIVTPYYKWVYYDESVKELPLQRNYAANRTGKVAWFVSNCHAKNYRFQYAQALREYIPVDIFGTCGDKLCPIESDNRCRDFVSQTYKFYLSFENANCRDYITEKFYLKGLEWDLLPIVMGPPRSDYEKVAPHNSFIHVEDYETPNDLAKYLHYLDKNDEAYNKYFLWKSTGEFINTFFACRLCAMLNAERLNRYYPDIERWWKGPKRCTKEFWNHQIGEKIIESMRNSTKINFKIKSFG